VIIRRLRWIGKICVMANDFVIVTHWRKVDLDSIELYEYRRINNGLSVASHLNSIRS